MDFKRFASSANKKLLLKVTEQGRSLVYIRSNKGRKMLPWGTPDLTGSKLKEEEEEEKEEEEEEGGGTGRRGEEGDEEEEEERVRRRRKK